MRGVLLFAFAAASGAARGSAAQDVLARRDADYISRCGETAMARDDVTSNRGTIARRGFVSAVADFCKQADGKTVPAQGYLSMATRVYISDGGDPVRSGVNGYVYVEVHNQQRTEEHRINADDCRDHLQQLSNDGSKCGGSQYHDTTGGTWQVGADTVSYQALAQRVLPAQDALDKLYDEGPLTSRAGADGVVDPFPSNFTGDVTPVPCHSHNDYDQAIPLFSALSAGCISVEADVWIYGDHLRVAHTDPGDQGPTLESLYLEPLKGILDAQGSIYPRQADQDVTLLIDFKSKHNETWDAVVKALKPLREAGYLSHWDGAFVRRQITIVNSGGAELATANNDTANPGRDMFVDAPLGKSLDGYDRSNAYYASGDWFELVRLSSDTTLSPDDLKTIRKQIDDAHNKTFQVRYYDIPPSDVWQDLLRNGVDRINVDDLHAVAGIDWTNRSTTDGSGSTSTGSGPASTTSPSTAAPSLSATALYLLSLWIAAALLLV